MDDIISKKYFNFLLMSNDLYLVNKLENLKNSDVEDFNKFLNLTQSFILENKVDLIEYIAFIGEMNGISKFTKIPRLFIHCDGLRMKEQIVIITKDKLDLSNDDIVNGHVFALFNNNDNIWEINKSLTINSLIKKGDTFSSLKFLFEWNWLREDFVSTDAWNYKEHVSKLVNLD